MAVGGIGDFGMYASKSTEKQPTSPASGSLTMDGFMKLMAVQLQNQDMSSPMDNAEMMSQLTQMSTVQAMNTFTELATTQYAMSMIGQDVKIASVDTNGKMNYIYGKICGINLSQNKVYVDGDSNTEGYGIGNIMEVGAVPVKAGDETDDENKDSSSTDKTEDKTETKTNGPS